MNIRYLVATALIASVGYVNAGRVFAQPGPENIPDCPSYPADNSACRVAPVMLRNPIVGWWHHKGTLSRCDNPSIVLREISAELLFQAGGTMVSVDTNPPASRQTAVGIWTQSGQDHYLWRMQFNRFNPDGSFDGVQDIQADMWLDESGDLATHTAKVRVLNADGSLRAQLCESGPSNRVGLE